MAETDLVAECTIESVEQNVATGWFTITTDVAGKFQTKYPERAQEAAALKGSRVRVFYSPDTRPQNINPHTGQPYRPNNYFNRAEEIFNGGGEGFTPPAGITVIGQPPTPAAPAQTLAPTAITQTGEFNRQTNPRDAWRMALTSGSERAVQTLPLMPVDQRDFDTQKAIATAWAKFIYFTPPPQQMEGTGVPMPEFPAIDGDDIPF